MQEFDLAKENATCDKDILVFLGFNDVVAFKYNDELEQSESVIMRKIAEPGANFETLLAGSVYEAGHPRYKIST